LATDQQDDGQATDDLHGGMRILRRRSGGYEHGILGAVIRTFTVVLAGVVSGIFAFVAFGMLLPDDLPGDTASLQLAMILMACAIAVAITGVGVATTGPWSLPLSLVIGIAGVIAGFGGLTLLVLSSLLAVGMFPDTLLEPLNLTVALIMVLGGLTGIGFLMRRSDPPTAAATRTAWLARSWPVAAGIAVGIGVAWLWAAFIWPLIPYECCPA
jgi:hypothetical protein